MILNEWQLRTGQKKRDEALAAAAASEGLQADVLRDFADEISQELDEYCGIRDGHVNAFPLESMDDLPESLVKARIARGWTQKKLADRLGVSEQMVQRDEKGAYEKASFARLAEVADVLGYSLQGLIKPTGIEPEAVRTSSSVSLRAVAHSASQWWSETRPTILGKCLSTFSTRMILGTARDEPDTPTLHLVISDPAISK